MFAHPLFSPQAAVTVTGVYVAWQLSPALSDGVTELARIDVASGRVVAARRLGKAHFDQAVAAGGSLWVATSSRAGEALLRLNPHTLAVTGRRWIGGGGSQGYPGHVLALAGGGLWVAGGNRLLHLSIPGGKIIASVALPGAATSDLSANAAGTVLVTGEADSSGRGAVQRRDPASGAVLASHPMLGVVAPVVTGPIGSAVWVSEATGMMGYVQRLDAVTLAARGGTCPDPAGANTSDCVAGTNGITARLANGLLWIIQVAGGKVRNYCAEPSDGRKLAPIRLPQPDRDVVLAITPDRILYAAPGHTAAQYLRKEAIPPACRARR